MLKKTLTEPAHRVVALIGMACYLFFATALVSCNSSKKINTDYLYFKNGADTVGIQQRERVIIPNDMLSIQVYSQTLNQEQTVIFNIPGASNSSTGNNASAQGYEVDSAGNIYMPVIGAVKADGLTKNQLQTALSQKLTNYVKNPSVIVRFLQFNINVLGEVHTPGIKTFSSDRVTIIDAIGQAGDLTDYGKRDDVTVVREDGNKKIYHHVDLRSKAISESPVYMLQPNDIVYVSPNTLKLKSLNVDPVLQRRTGLIFSVVSIVLGIASFFFYIAR